MTELDGPNESIGIGKRNGLSMTSGHHAIAKVRCATMPSPTSSSRKALNLLDISGPVAVLMAGLTLAALVVGLEHMYRRRKIKSHQFHVDPIIDDHF